MEKRKVRFLNRLRNRTVEKNGMDIEQYVKAVKELEPVARASYSEDTTTFKEDDFVAMLVLDGCFVVEMFLAYSDEVPLEADDPFRSMTRLQFGLHHDFLCLENQIPYLVLQKLFQLTQMGSDSSPGESHRLLPLTALRFFNRSRDLGGPANTICKEWVPAHLLDLVRKSYFPPPVESKHHSAMEESQWQSVMALQAETKQNGAAEESRLKCLPRTDCIK
ncbi:unnamed protein product [Cuscuta epithymum]|uniref:Uncharacterized protein n=1 Tax=Cuscuta epithymum TaxID=186058 RepID=A0AAV0EK82_9ASTE|nr:unnamed protein product [Cuscuta epithymum]